MARSEARRERWIDDLSFCLGDAVRVLVVGWLAWFGV